MRSVALAPSSGYKADAHARADDDLAVAGHAEGLLYQLRELAGDARSLVGRLEILDDDEELVTAEAGQGVLHAQARAQAAGHGLNERIPGRMSEAVVHVLEAV